MADVPTVTVADLADGAAAGPGLDASGQPLVPLMLVQLNRDIPAAALTRAAAVGRSCDRLLAGIAAEPLSPRLTSLLAALDLTLTVATDTRHCVPVRDLEAEAAALGAAVTTSPQASLVLGQVLRVTQDLPVAAALEVESFAYSTLLGGPEFRHWLTDRPSRQVAPPADTPVIVRRDGSVLQITLNRPDRRNAYDRQLRDALADALRIAIHDPAVDRVVLDGAGPNFSSGGDLDEFGTAPDLVTAHFIRTQAGAARLIDDLGARIEARVHGPCAGAGIELPAFAGTVAADASATFRLPEIAMGLIPGAGGTVSIPRRIGRWRTLYLALTGQPIDASKALAWGLVDKVSAGSPAG
jgi:enoyl-CoA hydratase/carnithine racemase